MGQALSRVCPISMSRLLVSALVFLFISASALTQSSKKAPSPASSVTFERALRLAQSGRCEEALPVLKKSLLPGVERDVRRAAGLAGIRCAMILNQSDPAIELLRMLNREFPRDPEILYVTTHTFSDLSSHAAQQLATFAPNSFQAQELRAESLEVQGKWDQAAREYQAVLQQNPRQPGVHFRLGRLLLSKPNPPPTVAEDAKKEFQQELEIDPNNAGAEYVLGELARQAQQLDEAIQHFSRAAKLDAGFGDAFLGLGSSLMSQRKFSEAVPPLQTAVKLEPQNPVAHYNLAMAYARSGRKEAADKEFAIHREMMQKSGGAGADQGSSPPETPQ
jgi:tetratricopeptide (TPR) repeat protein